MDRLSSSSSQFCSCSGRESMQAHRQAYRRPPIIKSFNTNHQYYIHTIPYKSESRRACVQVGSQSPRQQGDGTPNKDNRDGLALSEGRLITSLVTSGLSGTLAVVGATIARIDLFGQFRWLSTNDLLLGLTFTSALIALEGLLLAPPYDRLLGGIGRPGTKAGAVGLQLRTTHVGKLLSADTIAATLVLQQACIVAAQVVRRPGLTRTSPVLESGLVLLREASKELLQRGLLFTFIAAWLADRAFEAGADDTMLLPLQLPSALVAQGSTAAAASGLELYVTDAMRYIAAVLLTLAIMPPVANEAEAMRIGVASNLALVMVEQQQEEVEEQRRRRQQQQQQQRGGARAGAGEAGSSGVQEEGGERAEAYDEDLDSDETEAMLREYRLYDALGRCTSTGPPRLTYGLTLLRGLLRFGAPNLTFALTGNLAASLLASAVPQLLLLAYVMSGPKFLLESPPPPSASPSPEKQQALLRGDNTTVDNDEE